MKRLREYGSGSGRLALTVLLLMASWSAFAQKGARISRQQYIETYAELAMKEMARTGIPASITLAQGCLESDNGNSRLARRGNNHFGIKCHDWKGRKIYQDDDKRNECFRVYKSAYESYIDHSEFLTTRPRYAFLFELKPDDYKGWSRGLKKAGYATANHYARLLIQIIEENGLDRYDRMVLDGTAGILPEEPAGPGTAGPPVQGPGAGRQVMTNNRIEYIVAEEGDTPASLRKELDLYPNELFRYNDLERGVRLEPGQILYLQPKRRKAARGYEIHVLKEGETLYDVSQKYGVKMKHLYRMNHLREGEEPAPGAEIYLRRKKPEGRRLIPPPGKEEEDEPQELQFRFEG